MSFYDELDELDKILEETNTPMTPIDERARKIEQILVDCKEGKLDEAVRLIMTELQAVQDEQWRADMRHCEASNKQSRSEALEKAAEILDQQDSECAEHCISGESCNCLEKAAERIRKLVSDPEQKADNKNQNQDEEG